MPGIEILDARQRFGDPGVFRRVVLGDIALGRRESQVWHTRRLRDDAFP